MIHVSQSDCHFQCEVVERRVPLSLCIYGVVSKAEMTERTLDHTPLSNSHAHVSLGLQTSIPRGYRRRCCAPDPPPLPPRPSPSLSPHGNNTVGCKFFCYTRQLTMKEKGGWACACLCSVWLIDPTLCRISRKAALWKRERDLTVYGSCQHNHTPSQWAHLARPEAASLLVQGAFKVGHSQGGGFWSTGECLFVCLWII